MQFQPKSASLLWQSDPTQDDRDWKGECGHPHEWRDLHEAQPHTGANIAPDDQSVVGRDREVRHDQQDLRPHLASRQPEPHDSKLEDSHRHKIPAEPVKQHDPERPDAGRIALSDGLRPEQCGIRPRMKQTRRAGVAAIGAHGNLQQF